MNNEDEQDERTKLLCARGEVTAILRKYDLCGCVVLLGRHQLEAMIDLDSSWSKLQLINDDGAPGVRLRSKAADYGGDRAKQRADLEASVGMAQALAQCLGVAAVCWIKTAEHLTAATGAVHGPFVREHKQ